MDEERRKAWKLLFEKAAAIEKENSLHMPVVPRGTYLVLRTDGTEEVGRPPTLAAMRAYIRQWIDSPVWDENPHAGPNRRAWLARMRAAVDGLTTREAIAAWLAEASAHGIDPL